MKNQIDAYFAGLTRRRYRKLGHIYARLSRSGELTRRKLPARGQTGSGRR